MKRLFCILLVLTIAINGLARHCWAGIHFDGLLNNTSQIRTESSNPFFGAGSTQNLVGVNFYYEPGRVAGGAVAAGASVNGVFFDNINLAGPTPPPGPFVLTANGVAASMLLNMPFDQSGEDPDRFLNLGAVGPDAGTLNAVAHEMFYLSNTFTTAFTHNLAEVTFSGLGASRGLYVQVIGGDENWNGDIAVTANGTSIGTWLNVADNNVNNGSLFAFDTSTNASGDLTLNFRLINNNHAGISAIIIAGQGAPSAAVPEPASATLFAAGAMGLLGIVWRKRRAANSLEQTCSR
jgi:hypothetical protein